MMPFMMLRRSLPIVCVMLLPASAGAAEWHEKIAVGGDLRYRSELIKRESREDDSRDRIRARLRVTGEASECWSVCLGVATGSDDPVSTNTTLTGGYARKGILLDLAFLDFRPNSVPGLGFIAGKMNLPFEVAERTELMWDNDLTPEGLAVRYRRGAGARAELFLNGALFDIKDTDPDDLGEAWMLGGQAGLDAELPRGIDLTIGAGYFNYEGAIGRLGFFRSNEFYGNTTRLWQGTTAVGGYPYTYRGYARDFNIFEALVVVGFGPGDWVDLAFYGTYVNNIRADDRNVGWLAGGSVGRGRDRGALKLHANYRRLEPDAVIGIFTDSDFIGGGTDGKGWEIGFVAGAARGVELSATWFRNAISVADERYETEYERLQVDIQAKF